MNYDWNFAIVWEYRYALLGGLWITVKLSAAAIFFGTMAAIPAAFCLLSRNALLRVPMALLVQIVRGTPLLILFVFAYYFLPVLLHAEVPAIVTAWAVMSLYLAAFVSDVFRGSIASVPAEQVEAGMAIGMHWFEVQHHIVLPEMLRRSLPALVALYISLLKYATLASAISVTELLRTADLIIIERFKPLEIYLAVAGLYLVIVLPIGYAAQRIERHRWFRPDARTQL